MASAFIWGTYWFAWAGCMFPSLHGFLPEPKDMLLSLIGGSELPVAAGIDSTTLNFNRKLIDVWKNCRSEDDLEFHLFISLPYYLLILCKSWTWLGYNEIPSEKGFWGIENLSFFHVCCFCFVIFSSLCLCAQFGITRRLAHYWQFVSKIVWTWKLSELKFLFNDHRMLPSHFLCSP